MGVKIFSGTSLIMLLLASNVAFASKALVEAASQGNHTEVTRLLSNLEEDVNELIDDTTALHWAARRGDLPMVQELVKNGANINAVTSYNSTPLHSAALFGQVKVVLFLINSGINVEVVNTNEETALSIAKRSNHKDIFKIIKRKIVKDACAQHQIIKETVLPKQLAYIVSGYLLDPDLEE